MKSLFIGAIFVGVIGVGSVLGFSYYNADSEVKTEETQAEPTVQAESTPTNSAPTERTVETNGDVPWNYMSSEQIIAAQNNGKVVYLFSDAEALENYTVSLASNPVNEPYNKEDLAESWAGQIGAFILGVKDGMPSELDYFMKLEEVKSAMASYEYEKVPALVEEAKQLR